MAPETDVSVVHVPERTRYELRRGEEVLGSAYYRWDGGRMVMDHTVVEPAKRERGMGSTLARGALDDVRERGLRVVAQCPFIAAFIEEHPEYRDLLDEIPDDV